MQKYPLVSIIITNYNKRKYIKDCIYSVQNQTYKKKQIIVIDNLSTDGSNVLIKKFKDIIFLKNNLNKTAALNQINSIQIGLDNADGDLIFLLDGDDYFKKDKIQNVVKYFYENNELKFLCDIPIIFNQNIKKYFQYKISRLNNSYIWPTTFPTSSLCFEKKFLIQSMRKIYNHRFENLEIDFRLCYFLNILREKKKIINKSYTYYRQVNDGVMSNLPKFSKKWWIKRFQAYEYFFLQNEKNKIISKKSFGYFFTNLFKSL